MYPQTLTEYDHFLHLNGHGHSDTLTFQANLSGNQLQVIMVHHPGDRSLRGPGRAMGYANAMTSGVQSRCGAGGHCYHNKAVRKTQKAAEFVPVG